MRSFEILWPSGSVNQMINNLDPIYQKLYSEPFYSFATEFTFYLFKNDLHSFFMLAHSVFQYKFHNMNLIFLFDCSDFVHKFHIIVLDSKLLWANIFVP